MISGSRNRKMMWDFNQKFINSTFCACAVKIWLKIALNAVRLPKFEAINGKWWSPRTMVVKDLRQRSMLTWFSACAESCVIFSTWPYIVLADNSIYLNRSAIKVVYWIGKSRSGISNMRENLPPTHRSRDMAHAQWLQMHYQWYPMEDVRTHNSRTDSRGIFKLGGPWRGLPRDPPCMTSDQGQKVKGQCHKVT